MKITPKTILLILIYGFLTGCNEDDTPPLTTPILTTTIISNITPTTVFSGGTITNNGGSAVTARGVVWNTMSNPDISLSTKTNNGSGIGNFTSSITELTPHTTYFIRAYATNEIGTAYGDEISFTTSELLIPTVTTTAITNNLGTSATSGGNITSDGGTTVTARGIVWSTTATPTVDLLTKTTQGSGQGNFTSDLTQLVIGTNYYVRAYATNAVGTAYGNELMFQAVSPFAALDVAIADNMNQYGIPGASIAIVKNEKLVYLKSYGYADLEKKEPASNDNLWRIGSISKPITAIAIYKLAHDGLVTLDQKVFGPNSILGNDYGEVPPGSNKEKITIRHLVEHTSGWANTPNDPVFLPAHLTQTQIITDVFKNRPLASLPGTTNYYSNFGYLLLGKVIEKVTRKTYENYVRTAILNPMGITEMKIGKSTLVERFPNEVKYYQSEYSPYLMNIPRMDSPAGWIASAKDLAKFIVRVDRLNYKPDILPPSYLNQLYFGYFNWLHYGSLPGTSASLSRLNDTFSYVVMVNTRTEKDYNNINIFAALNTTMITQIQAVGTWPRHDLFD